MAVDPFHGKDHHCGAEEEEGQIAVAAGQSGSAFPTFQAGAGAPVVQSMAGIPTPHGAARNWFSLSHTTYSFLLMFAGALVFVFTTNVLIPFADNALSNYCSTLNKPCVCPSPIPCPSEDTLCKDAREQFQTTRDSLKQKLADLRSDVEVKASAIVTLESEKKDILATAATQTTKISELSSENTELSSKNSELSSKITELSSKIAKMSEKKETAEGSSISNGPFTFDTVTRGFATAPNIYAVTNGGKTAKVSTGNGTGKQILLIPQLHSGTYVVRYKVDSVGRIFYVGFLDTPEKVLQGCSLRSDGVIHAMDKEAGNIGRHINQGDSIEATVDLTQRTVRWSLLGSGGALSRTVPCDLRRFGFVVYPGFTGFAGSQLTIL